MGLDQYLFKVKKKCTTEKDLEKLRECVLDLDEGEIV